jgi:Ala-tRNA(Pro) deacylase
MLAQSLRDFLDAHHVPYRVVAHAPRYTAQEVAAAAHVSGSRLAKAVLLRQIGRPRDFLLAVLPASEVVDLERLGRAVAHPVEVAREEELARLCSDFEPGATPPFGELTQTPVIADRCLAEQETITFPGGTHTALVEMRWHDFATLAQPRIVDCGRLPTAPEPSARMP